MKSFKVPGMNFSWRHDGQDHPSRDPYKERLTSFPPPPPGPVETIARKCEMPVGCLVVRTVGVRSRDYQIF